MRTILLGLLVSFCMPLAAQRVSLGVKEQQLETVIGLLRQQTGYHFIYSDKLLSEAKAVTIDFKDLSLRDALDKLFADQPLKYSIENKTVVISRRETSLPGDVVMGMRTLGAAATERDAAGRKVGGKEIPGLRLSDTLFSRQPLDEVIVKARPPVTEAGASPGTIVYNVSGSADAIGQTVLETLKRAPGVTVDNNSIISLNGRAGVTVMLDNKQTYLSGKELADLLQAMPSSGVRSIELIGSPGAKYDASGTAGIINIKTNRMTHRGLNGSINSGLSYGISLRQNTDLSLNYRKGRVNLFASYNHAFGDYTYDYGTDRFQNSRYYSSATYDRDKRQRLNSRAGADVSIGERHTIGVLVSANFIPGGGITKTRTYISVPNSSATEQVLDAVNDYYLQNTQRYNVNLNYQYDDKAGHQLTIDADYGYFDKDNANLQSNVYANHAGAIINQNRYRTINGIDIRLHGGKVDYTTPLWKGKLEAGGKYSFVSSVNDGKFYHLLSFDSLDVRRSNYFAFREGITSGYVSYARVSGKWSWQAGVRVEHTRNRSDTLERTYTNLFPSLGITYRYRERQSLGLAYSRRIDRPAYPDLNPFVYMLDELSFWQGNPYLQPQLSHRVTLQWVRGNATIIGLSYGNASGYFARVNDTTGVSQVVMIPRNIGRQHSAALTITQNSELAAWWNISLNATLSYLRNEIDYSAYTGVNAEMLSARVNLVQRFAVSKSVNAEISGIYQSRRLSAANERGSATSQVDLALVKTFSPRWSLRVALNDVYKGSRYVSLQDMGGYYIRNYSYYETRQLRINLSYRFADLNAKASRARTSALDAENGRIR